MTTETITALSSAIDRSRSHNEIASVEIEASDLSEVLAELGSIYGGEIDSAQENDGSHDVWGYTEDMEDGQMDWRINVTIVTA